MLGPFLPVPRLSAGEKPTVAPNTSKVKRQYDRSSPALSTPPATDVPTAQLRLLFPTKAPAAIPLCSKHPNHSRISGAFLPPYPIRRMSMVTGLQMTTDH